MRCRSVSNTVGFCDFVVPASPALPSPRAITYPAMGASIWLYSGVRPDCTYTVITILAFTFIFTLSSPPLRAPTHGATCNEHSGRRRRHPIPPLACFLDPPLPLLPISVSRPMSVPASISKRRMQPLPGGVVSSCNRQFSTENADWEVWP